MSTRRGSSERSKGGASAPEAVPLKEHFSKRLAVYAATAGAAGVGLLATAQPARADIIYTPADITIGPLGSLSVDLNADGTSDFTLGFNSYSVTFRGGSGDGVLAHHVPDSATFALALGTGANIGPGGGFYGFAFLNIYCSACSGYWVNVSDRYLGLEFLINGQDHFGWARLNVQGNGPYFNVGTLTGYAYETNANQSIMAGQTSEATPEPGTLGLLALGSLGLGFWRRRRESVTSDK